MSPLDDEQARLRSVMLQNEQSILQARQRAEEALRQQSEWLRITLASIGDAVISTDAEGRVTFMNRVAETLTGWNHAEAVGRALADVFQIVHEQTRAPAENPALRAMRKGTVVGLTNQTVLIARDGTEHPIDDSAAPIRADGETSVGAVLVFRDVGARKLAEETQARLAAIVESSEDAIVGKSLDGIVRTWNAGAERLFGYAPDEIIGRSITTIIPPERQSEETEILSRIAKAERVEHFETVRLTKSGRLIDISLSVSPIRDSSGRIIGAAKVARDITDRKRAEEFLRETDRRKDQFIALLAHELRNPLAPLRNGLQVMRLAPDDANAVAQARTVMERQLAHMVRLIDDLLDVARINQNKMELRRSRVVLADVVNSAVETVRSAIEEAGHELIIDLPAEPLYLDADLTRLAQVLSNLLANSARYTRRGGRISLQAQRQNGEIVITVRDNGIGIPSDSLPTIFNMFSQVDRSIERSAGGLGIGLSLVKGLVEMHDGVVSVSSAGLGQGSTFTIRLPAPSDLSSSPSEPEAAVMTGRPRRRILVVDDNHDSADSMAAMLRLVGNDVVKAHDGLEAIEAARQFHPEVILIDVGMPRMNGYEATRRIRKLDGSRRPIIIALTGWGQEGDRDSSRAAGCDGHLVKPVTLTDLETMLTELENGDAHRHDLAMST